MQRTIRGHAAQVNTVVGPMVMIIGGLAAVAAVVLAITLEAPGLLVLFIPAALALGAGIFILRMSRRARLSIDADGFTWCGALGSERSLRWEQVYRIAPPPPGHSRIAAIAELRDGPARPIIALWEPPTSPLTLLGAIDHREAFAALVSAHRQWLAGRR